MKELTPKIVVSISDTHCGSEVGLMPPEVELNNGNVIGHGNNLVQRFLWETWELGKQWISEATNGRPFILLLNGDMIDGVHHGGKQLIAQLWDEHLAIAETCLRPLVDMADASLMTKGTEVHTLDLEDTLAAKLGCETGKAKDKWLFEVNGVLNDAAHHMGTTKRKWLESGEGDRIMANAILNYHHCGQRVPSVFWRAHRHVGGYVNHDDHHFLVCGAWQFLTRYGHKVVCESIPVPSIQFMDFTNPHFPIHYEKKFYPSQPEIKTF